MSQDKLGTQIESQKMTRGGSTFDKSTMMVPAVGAALLFVLMAVFYVYYRRKNRRRPSLRQPQHHSSPSRSKRAQTLAENGGLPPARSSGKEATP